MFREGIRLAICAYVHIAYMCYTSSVDARHRLSYCVVLRSLFNRMNSAISTQVPAFTLILEKSRLRSDGKQDKVTCLADL